MGCRNSATVAPSSTPPAPQDSPPTVAVVPSASIVLEQKATEEADEEESLSSVDSGPAGPSFAELLYRRTQTPADVFAEGEHEFCIFGAVQPGVSEQEFEQKKLLSSRDEGDPAALREHLASVGVGLACRKGRKADCPNNQDNILFCRTREFTVCGVADGHGDAGHWASHWVARYAMSMILAETSSKHTLPSDGDLMRIFNVVHEALTIIADRGLYCPDKEEGSGEGKFDLSLSGSTLSLFWIQHSSRKAVSAWVGDSRCVLFHTGEGQGAFIENPENGGLTVGTVSKLNPSAAPTKHTNPFKAGNLRVQSITADHNPRDLGERQRMYSFGGNIVGGRVQTTASAESKASEGGLTMTRAIGDVLLHSFGVIHKPGIRRIDLGKAKEGSAEGVLCCSDGVWEFLNNDEAARYVGVGGREIVSQATEDLVAAARSRWLEQEEEETDDLSALVVWL